VKNLVRLLLVLLFAFVALGSTQTAVKAETNDTPWASTYEAEGLIYITLHPEEGNFPVNFNGGIVSYRESQETKTWPASDWVDNGDSSFTLVEPVTNSIDRIWIAMPSLAIDWHPQQSGWRGIAGENGVERCAFITSSWEEGSSTLTLVLNPGGYQFPTAFGGDIVDIYMSNGDVLYVNGWTTINPENPQYVLVLHLQPEEVFPHANLVYYQPDVPMEWWGSGPWEPLIYGLVWRSYDPCEQGPIPTNSTCWLQPDQVISSGNLEVRENNGWQWFNLLLDQSWGTVFSSPNVPILVRTHTNANISSQGSFSAVVTMLQNYTTVAEWTSANLDQPIRVWNAQDIKYIFLPLTTR
jgi:hypothetical protein